MRDREQVHGYIPRALRKHLRDYAAKKGVSESSVTHAALSRYLADADDTPIILRKLDRMERRLDRLHRDAGIHAEAFAAFVQAWMAHTPRLPEAQRPAAEIAARQRFSAFADYVAERIAEGSSFVAGLIRTDLADADELAVIAGRVSATAEEAP